MNSSNSTSYEAMKYPGSQLKLFGEKKPLYENDFESSVYDFDSVSEYLPLSIIHLQSFDSKSDDEISLKSNLSIDIFINDAQSNL